MSDSRSFEVLTASPVRLSSSPARSYRSWSDEEKARIVGETLVGGANVSAIARSNGLDPSQLFAWRRKAIASGAVAPLGGSPSRPVRFTRFEIAVSKYADGLPLYRQEAIYARDQVELDRSLMAQWMGKVGFELQPLADYVLERIKQGERVFADETTRRWLLVPARPKRPGYGPMPVTTDPSAAPMVAY